MAYKFNNGYGAIICDEYFTILLDGVSYSDYEVWGRFRTSSSIPNPEDTCDEWYTDDARRKECSAARCARLNNE